jgi:hypothetical protein
MQRFLKAILPVQRVGEVESHARTHAHARTHTHTHVTLIAMYSTKANATPNSLDAVSSLLPKQGNKILCTPTKTIQNAVQVQGVPIGSDGFRTYFVRQRVAWERKKVPLQKHVYLHFSL